MSKIHHLIEKVFIKKQLGPLSHESLDLFSKPVITVARDPGSGGKPIAQQVAKRLKFEFYDDSLIEEIAKSARRRKGIIKGVDERSRNLIEDLVHNLFNPEYISEEVYIKHLVKTVLTLANQGKAVFLGRGTNLIIPNTASLDVLVTANKQIRIERAIKHEGHSLRKARQIIDKYSKERREFVSGYFKKGYHNPIYYDLVINTEYFTVNQARDLIISAFEKKFTA